MHRSDVEKGRKLATIMPNNYVLSKRSWSADLDRRQEF